MSLVLYAKKSFIFIFIIIFSISLLVGCSTENAKEINKSEKATHQENQVQETTNETAPLEEPTQAAIDLLENAPAEPTTLEEIVAYPAGPLAGLDKDTDLEYMVNFVKNTLPPIDASKDEDEVYLDKWWRAFRYLFAESYPDPNDVIRKMTVEQFGNPAIEDPRYHFKEQLNVLVILDVSGSMAYEMNGKSMMQIAKDSIQDFVSNLPENVNVGLRVYGHEGKRTGKIKEQSCQSTELIYDMQPFNANEFTNVLTPIEPTGWTPIAFSLEQVKKDFAKFPSETNTNLVYVVSDGAETCGGDPVKVTKELVSSNIEPIVNVIGFNVDMEGQSHLKEIADAGGGVYTHAGNETQLEEAFNQAKAIAEQWKEWHRGAKKEAWKKKEAMDMEIMKMSLEKWSVFYNRELNNTMEVLRKLNSDRDITTAAYNFLYSKNAEKYDFYVNFNTRELWSDYLQKIDEMYEKTIQDINQKYEEGTKQ